MNIRSRVMNIERRTLYILLVIGAAAVSIGMALFSMHSI